MNLEAIAAAVAILIAVGGALVKLIEVIIHQTTAAKFQEFEDESDREIEKVSKRINRLERRTAVLETRVIGDSDTFSGVD